LFPIAARAGISKEEIEEDFGDLYKFMEMAIHEEDELFGSASQ
jgi:translation initiation factor 2 alpha subunit (eIF-2alpha)